MGKKKDRFGRTPSAVFTNRQVSKRVCEEPEALIVEPPHGVFNLEGDELMQDK